MPDPLWQKAEALARVIKESPQGRSYRRVFDLRRDEDNFPIRLSEVTAVYHSLKEHPLLLGTRLNRIAQVGELCAAPEDLQWLKDAMDTGFGLQLSIEFLRSRLPGYPAMLGPHLRPGSPLFFVSDPVFVDYFPWDMDACGTILKLGGAPPDLSNLGGPLDGNPELLALAAELAQRPTWQRFVAAEAGLEQPDRDLLGELGDQFEAQMRDEVVDEIAGSRSQGRFEYRMAALQELVASAEGAVRAYLNAFAEIHDLLTFVTGFMETVITHETLLTIEPYRMDVGGGDDLRPAALAASIEDPFIACPTVLAVSGSGPTSDCLLYPRHIDTHLIFDGSPPVIRAKGLLGIV